MIQVLKWVVCLSKRTLLGLRAIAAVHINRCGVVFNLMRVVINTVRTGARKSVVDARHSGVSGPDWLVNLPCTLRFGWCGVSEGRYDQLKSYLVAAQKQLMLVPKAFIYGQQFVIDDQG